MGIRAKDLNDYVITPTLTYLGLYSDSARNLLLGTCAQESQMGTYLKQNPGPALGIYQIEPETHQDVLNNYLFSRPELKSRIDSLVSPICVYANRNQELIVNLAYATAIARLIYLRIAENIPSADNIQALASFYKRYYNGPGKATIDQFIANYNAYVKGQI